MLSCFYGWSGGERRAAHAQPPARVLPQLLVGVQLAERARDDREGVLPEFFRYVRIVQGAFLYEREYVGRECRDFPFVECDAAGSQIGFAPEIVCDFGAIGVRV